MKPYKTKKRTRDGEINRGDGARAYTSEVLFAMRRVMAVLRECPYASCTEVAESEGWNRWKAAYVLEAMWSDGLVARYRASEVKTWGIGVPSTSWLYVVVPGARKPARVAA